LDLHVATKDFGKLGYKAASPHVPDATRVA
jgi:hypothetical protein